MSQSASSQHRPQPTSQLRAEASPVAAWRSRPPHREQGSGLCPWPPVMWSQAGNVPWPLLQLWNLNLGRLLLLGNQSPVWPALNPRGAGEPEGLVQAHGGTRHCQEQE